MSVPETAPPYLSVVSPVYGAPELVLPLVERLVAALGPLAKPFEVILVNDACPKESWSEIEKAVALHPQVVGINLSRNFGQHYAITAGLDHTRGEWVVVMDCDLQDQPEEIPILLARAEAGYDIVFGQREIRKDPWTKRAASLAFSWVYRWMGGLEADRTVGNFSVAHRKVIEAVRRYRERDRAYPLLLNQVGFRRSFVPIEHAPRASGRSAYSLRKLIDFAIQVIVSQSNKPLRLSIKLGALIAAVALAYAFFLIIRFLAFGVEVPGWTTLAVLISLFSGMLSAQLGVLGLYLGKVFDEIKDRPLYVIDTILGPRKSP